MDGEAAAIPPSVFPAAIGRHLASVLDQTYGPADMDSATDRFAGLLTQLRAALSAQKERDARAFHDEFLSLVPNLRRFAISLTKDAARADDLVQDTMLKAWRSRARFAADTNLGAWLFTIMRNVFYSDYRKSMRETPMSPGDEASRLVSIPEQPGRLDLQDMAIALAKLPEVMRQALVLVAIENLSYEEAAVVMACKIGTVKSRVWRAREQIAVLLGIDPHELGADRVTMSVVNGTGLAATC
ncbi:sigma-70 family RNA polymerase sigma factor [Methylobacterium haplocladii]